MKVDLFIALFFPLLLGILIRADKIVFTYVVDDEEYTFPHCRSRVKQLTPQDLVTRAIDKNI